MSDDELIILRAIKVADAAHVVEVLPHTTWAYRWACTCGERSVEADFGTASFEGAEHKRKAIAAAVLAALAGRLLPSGFPYEAAYLVGDTFSPEVSP